MVSMRAGAHSKEALKRASARAVPAARTPAQRSNFSPLVARGYAWWRARSLSWLSGEAFSLAREARLFRALARPQPGERWLDVGTSAGFYAGVLADAGASVLAIDLSPAMLQVARRRERSPRIDFALLDVEHSGLPDGSFQGASVGATLGEVADPDRTLAELERLLAPGGRLWLMYVARDGGEGQRVLSRLGGLTFPDPAEIARALPGCDLRASCAVGTVTFALFVRRAA